MFSAFRSDDEADTKSKPKTKPITKPKSKPISKPVKSSSRQEKPRPVSKPSNTRPPFKKKEVIEPSEVDQKKRFSSRRGRGIKPGDTDNRGKRFFDRKSGSGRGRGAKKSGAGKSNWGKAGEYNTNFSISGDGVQVPAETEETTKPTEEKETEDEVPPEPEKETFTLKEFMKKKAEKRVGKAFENLSVAEVEEVKDGKVYTKKDKSKSETEDVFFQVKDSADKKEKGKKQNNSRGKKAVEGVGFTVKNQDRERRSFGRGRGRGGFRGRGGYKKRGGYSNSKRVNVDTNDFPELGA